MRSLSNAGSTCKLVRAEMSVYDMGAHIIFHSYYSGFQRSGLQIELLTFKLLGRGGEGRRHGGWL